MGVTSKTIDMAPIIDDIADTELQLDSVRHWTRANVPDICSHQRIGVRGSKLWGWRGAEMSLYNNIVGNDVRGPTRW